MTKVVLEEENQYPFSEVQLKMTLSVSCCKSVSSRGSTFWRDNEEGREWSLRGLSIETFSAIFHDRGKEPG